MPESDAPCRLTFLIRDLNHGGAQRQLVTLAKALALRADFEVSVVHFYPGVFEAELKKAGIRTHCVGKQHRWDLLGFFGRLARCMRELRPNVIHGYLHESNLMTLFLKPLCGFPRIVWGIRDSKTDADTWGLLGKLSFRLNCLLSGFADVVIANSQAGRDYYVSHGYPRKRFKVVANGIDTEKFQPVTNDNNGSTFTVVGRLHPIKDHATFLRALAFVPKALGRFIGDGDSEYAREMQQLANQLGISERVTWEAARNDLPVLYPTLDCLASTSSFEGFSNVIGEAMAAGVPCIASEAGDSAWLVGDTRWIFPPGSAEALAEKMRAFLRLDAQERRSWGMQNRERILTHFTVSHMVERTASILKNGHGRTKARVLWITTGLGTGGAEMMLTQLIQGLNQHEHTVISLTAGGKYVAPLKAAGATVHHLDMSAGKPTPKALWRLIQLTRQAQPDVMMGWMYHGCFATLIARLAVRSRIIWNIRQSLYDLKLEKRGSAIVIRSLAWLSWIPERITYNSKLSATQHEKVGYLSKKTQLIPNGFDLEKWRPLLASTEQSRPLTVGRLGRYTAMKDYPTLLEAAARIVREIPETHFLLAGTGVDSHNAELTVLIEKLGLTKNVKLLGEQHNLPELTASLDLAVSSSAFGEGFPNVVGEAMACAVPVVATDIGDTRWVMGECGRLVPARDPAALAEACVNVLRKSPEERKALGEAGRQRIQNLFSIQQVLTQFDKILLSR